jgi:hypothetical protein
VCDEDGTPTSSLVQPADRVGLKWFSLAVEVVDTCAYEWYRGVKISWESSHDFVSLVINTHIDYGLIIR